jgi:hypothetical protein
MKLKSILLTIVLLPFTTAEAQQWTTNGANLNNANTGKVGIGLGNNTPQDMLHVANGSVMASDPVYYGINARLSGADIPVLKFSRDLNGSHTSYHNASVGQFYNSPASQYSLGFGTGLSSSGDQNANTNAMTIMLNGNIGIGTTTPSAQLEVANTGTAIFRNMNYSTNGYIDGAVNIFRNNSNSSSVNTILNLGNYWNNLSSNTSILAVDFRSGDGNGVTAGNPSGRIKVQTAWTSPYMDFDLNGSNVMHLQDGKVGIGNASPDAMLTVSGQVHAQEVKVTVAAPGPDYVFEKDYKLTSLEEIKNYIDQNKHLPEVPSAKEMAKNGVQLGEMNMLLLKKIEELTLYVIELKKRDEAQQKEIETLKNGKK